MTKKKEWWHRHTEFESDALLAQILESDGNLSISPKELNQLAKDFKKLKNGYINLGIWIEAGEQHDALPEEEKARRRKEAEEIGKELKKWWNS